MAYTHVGREKNMFRIVIISMVVVLLGASLALAEGGYKSNWSPTKPYKLIYNSDASAVMFRGTSAADYIHGNVGFLKNTNVDAVFWEGGGAGNVANYDSDILELVGERIGKVTPLLQELINGGNDPPKILVPEFHDRGVDVFFSYRLNDCHDSFGSPHVLPTFKLEHPEWLIGSGHPYGGKNQLNFAVPEVRDVKFDIVEEIFRKYDFDGLEIDLMRNVPYFIPGTEPQNAPILTQWLGRVRDHLNQRGIERGRPIPLAVRVTETMEACQLDGFEIQTWVDQGLVDMIIVGNRVIDIEIEKFKAVTEGTDVQVYATLYAWPSGYNPISPEMARGLATNYHYQGGDGIYTFNWNAHSYVHRPVESAEWAYQMELLREVDDPEAMYGKAKMFPADRGKPGRYNEAHQWLNAELPVALSSGGDADVPIMVGEDFTTGLPPGSIELRATLEGLSGDDVLEMTLNQEPLTGLQRSGNQISVFLEPDQLGLGLNEVGISLLSGNLTVDRLEIHVSERIPE